MEVQVTNIFGRSVTYFIDETWTVLKLKNLYSQNLESFTKNWYLMFEGKFLQNSSLLVDYNIQEGSVIHVTNRFAHRMTQPVELRIVCTEQYDAKLRTSLQESFPLQQSKSNREIQKKTTVLMYAEANWSVQRIKREFAQQRQIQDWKSYKLYANGIPLSENNLLKDYHIQNDATLHFTHTIRSRRFGIGNLKKYIVGKFFLKPV